MRWSRLGIIGVMALVAGSAVVALGGPAGAVTVSTEAELRAAFGDPAETEIVLANDITLSNCDDATGGDVDRDSATPLSLDGFGHTVRQQCEGFRVFEQAGTGALTFTNVTVTNGDQIGFSADQEGGGIRAGGDVTLDEATITGNLLTGQNPHGGGIFAVGDITVTNSVISGNRAFDPGDAIDARGGGFFTFSGDITITDSAINENEARSPLYAVGGAFWTIDGDVTMTRSSMLDNAIVGSDVFGGGGGTQNGLFDITDSTIAGNTANGGQGNASASALGGRQVVLVNSTVSDNVSTAQDTGAAIRAEQLTLVYATVVSNTGEESANLDVSDGNPTQLTSFASVVALPIGGPNCDLNGSTTVSHGYNFSDDGTCGFTAGTDVQNGGDPLLAPLGGSPIPTRHPEIRSPLVDKIPGAMCQSDGATGITTDQLGTQRPFVLDCDIGAIEIVFSIDPPGVFGPVPTFTG